MRKQIILVIIGLAIGLLLAAIFAGASMGISYMQDNRAFVDTGYILEIETTSGFIDNKKYNIKEEDIIDYSFDKFILNNNSDEYRNPIIKINKLEDNKAKIKLYSNNIMSNNISKKENNIISLKYSEEYKFHCANFDVIIKITKK